MFYNCTNLVGGAGTTYDASHTDYTYAHIDGGQSNPGYFTEKPAGYTTYTDTNNATAPVPTGFTVSSDPSEQTIAGGLVVKDSNNNEWVWVPVDDVDNMVIYGDTAYPLSGDIDATSSVAGKSAIISGLTRGTPGLISFREPDVLIGSGQKIDYENYGKLGYAGLTSMGRGLVRDYEKMVESVNKYGGFYVGRYELSGTVASAEVKANQAVLVNKNWYDLYNACKNIDTGTTGVVEAQMICGSQWDTVVNFISGAGYNINNSEGWGNYKGTSVKASDGVTELKASGTAIVLNTGSTTYTKARNIYDIAGNCTEWTQEAYARSYRVHRGGYSSDGVNTGSAKTRKYDTPTKSTNAINSELTSRAVLYVK